MFSIMQADSVSIFTPLVGPVEGWRSISGNSSVDIQPFFIIAILY